MLTGRPLYTNGHFRLGIPNNVMPLPNPRGFINVLTREIKSNYARPGRVIEGDRMVVEVPVVTKTASAIVAVFCVLSLVFGSLSSFQMVHPFVAVILLVTSGWFYGMGILIQRKNKRRR